MRKVTEENKHELKIALLKERNKELKAQLDEMATKYSALKIEFNIIEDTLKKVVLIGANAFKKEGEGE